MKKEFTELSNRVIGCAIEVHRTLGPGLLESTYSQCLAREFDIKGIQYINEWPLAVQYKGIALECGYRIDFLVEEQLIIELKSVEELKGIHQAQIMTYLKLSNVHHGLLINFNVERLVNGLKSFYINHN